MQDESQKLESFTRRAFILTSGKAVLATVLAARLFDLQILKSDEFKQLAEKNKNKLIYLKPLRGKILDKFGEIIADNKIEYNLIVDKESLIGYKADHKAILSNIASILDLDEEQKEDNLKKYKQTVVGKELVLKEHLTREELIAFEFYKYKLPGCYIDIDYQRNYHNTSCTNIIGYIASQDKSIDSAEARLVKVGKTGVELKFDHILKGSLGYKEVEVDSKGVIKKEKSSHSQIDGTDLHLTVSSILQKKLYDSFDTQHGSAVIIDANKGDILALVSVPNYDANIITDGLSINEWQKLTSDPGLPLINKAISASYPPGSLFKIVTALAYLETGNDPNSTVFCSGATFLGKHRFGCWKKEGHGTVNLEMALERSCNCFFYKAAEKTGIEKINECAYKLGLGQKLFDELPFVSSGNMPSPEWKRKKHKQSWSLGDTYNTAIGQGFVLTSIFQLCVMFARITTGNVVNPTLVYNKLSKEKFSLGFQQKNLEIIQNALYRVINSEHGTARLYREKDYLFYGKTGTAQVVSKKGRSIDLSSEMTPWKYKNHGLFAGGAKKGEKHICISIMVEHIGAGVKTIPIAKAILEEAFNYV